jgi:hypothetical protein
MTRSDPARGGLSFLTSVQNVLRHVPFRYWDGNHFRKYPIHLMLFDPADGCYHAFLTPRPEQRVSREQFSRIVECLRIYRQILNLDEIFRWIARNVAEGPGKVLALNVVEHAKSGCDVDPIADDPDYWDADVATSCLYALFSSLPSHRHWDICGFYDRFYADEQPVGTSAWELTPDRQRLVGFRLEQAVEPSKSRVPALKTETPFRTMLELHEAIQTVSASAMLFDGSPANLNARNGAPEGLSFAYDAYDRLYGRILNALYPDTAAGSSWQSMLYSSLAVSQILVGILFIDVKYRSGDDVDSSEFDWPTFARSLELFRVEKHRDLLAGIEKLLLAEFDKCLYADVERLDDVKAVLEALCANMNYLTRCEQCAIWNRELGQTAGWSWIERGVGARFEKGVLAASPEELMHLSEGTAPLKGLGWVTHIDCASVGIGEVSLFLVTKEHGALESPTFLDYLSLFREQRRQIILQKLEALVRGLKRQIELRRTRDQVMLEQEVQHYLKNATGPLARLQAKVKDAMKYLPDARRAWPEAQSTVLFAQLSLINFFLELRQLAVSTALRPAAVGEQREELDLGTLLATVYLAVVLASKEFAEAIAQSAGDPNAIARAAETVAQKCNAIKAQGGRSLLIQAPEAYETIAGLMANRATPQKFIPEGCEQYLLRVTPQQFINLYTALVEIMSNHSKHEMRYLFAEVQHDTDGDVLFFTSAKGTEECKAVELDGKRIGYEEVKHFLSDTVTGGGFGFSVIRAALAAFGGRYSVVPWKAKDNVESAELVERAIRKGQERFWSAITMPTGFFETRGVA